MIREGELPVFWACGVTPQLALEAARLDWAITHRPGYMFALTRPEDVQLFDRSMSIHHQFGVRSEMLTPQEAHAKNPLLNVDDVIACHFTPDDGHCTPESVVMGYATGARRHGATVLTHAVPRGFPT